MSHRASSAKLIHVVAQVGESGDTEYREYPRTSTLDDLTVQGMLFSEDFSSGPRDIPP
jgi:hypothetical protein